MHCIHNYIYIYIYIYIITYIHIYLFIYMFCFFSQSVLCAAFVNLHLSCSIRYFGTY